LCVLQVNIYRLMQTVSNTT